MMNKISAVFGSHVFSDQVMRERLPKAVYKSLKATIDKGEPLDTSIADSVAAAMKEYVKDSFLIKKRSSNYDEQNFGRIWLTRILRSGHERETSKGSLQVTQGDY